MNEREALDKLHRFSFGAVDEIDRTDIAGLVQVIADALNDRDARIAAVRKLADESGPFWLVAAVDIQEELE